MSDKMRWRYGDTNPVVAAVDAETVIEIGDMVYQDVDDAKSASMLAGDSTGQLLESFAARFLGVAMQRSHAGDTSPIRVATTGVFEFDCPSGTAELGDLVGPDVLVANPRLLNQQVSRASFVKRAIGRVAKRNATPGCTLLIDIRSTVMTGGVAGIHTETTE